jgi:predicted LPLAT superfamily acyltransferase
MKSVFYKLTIILSKLLGVWIFVLISGAISTGYFLFARQRRKVSKDFYCVLFPEKGRYYHLWCVWKQYQRFTNLFRDRFILLDYDKISYQAHGWEHLHEVLENGQGGIILMSHVGNWEIAAHLLKRRKEDLKLLLYLGTRQKEQLEKLQKENLTQSDIKVIAVDQDGGSPFNLIESNAVLKAGGLVSLTGDIIWSDAQRQVPVEFLGHEVFLPESPHLMSMISDRPLFTLFCMRTGRNKYTVHISPPTLVRADSRKRRSEAVRKSAQSYADLLEKMVRQYPDQWFHFEPFLGRKLLNE